MNDSPNSSSKMVMDDPPGNGSIYSLTSTMGRRLQVPKELYDVLEKFRNEKKTGAVTVHFKTGGIAQVAVNENYYVK